MSTFIAFLANSPDDAGLAFKSAVDVARRVKQLPMAPTRGNPLASVVSFNRIDGSGSAYAEDSGGNWVLLAGTCITSNSRVCDASVLLNKVLDDPHGLALELDGFF